jgi:hypothetical protein
VNPPLQRFRRAFAHLTCPAAFVLAAAAYGEGAARAQTTIQVSTTAQQSSVECTLTDAIIAANLQQPFGACPSGLGVDTIHVPAGDYVLTTAYIDEWGERTGLPFVQRAIRITGAGPGVTTIRRDPSAPTFRLLKVQAPFELSDLTLAGGDTGSDRDGGAILAETFTMPGGGRMRVRIRNVAFDNNHALYGGALGDAGFFFGPFVEFDIADSTFSGNAARGGGGALSASPGAAVIVRHSQFDNNIAAEWGGAIHAKHQGVLIDVADSTFEGNRANGQTGGAINAFETTLTRVTFTNNLALARGGGLYSYGSRPIIVDSTFTGNTARRGGAIEIHGGSIEVRGSTFAGNSATQDHGGGIFLDDRVGTSRIVNSTFSGNTAVERAGAIGLFGGGLTLVNVTVTGNIAWYGAGTAQFWNGDATLRLSNSIVAGNSRPDGVPNDVQLDPSEQLISLGHNLIGTAETAQGAFIAAGDLTGTTAQPLDAGLLPLAANGGPTSTHALAPVSAALDAGSTAPPGTDDACAPVDQRGVHRPGAGTATCDIGAFERTISFPLTLHVGAGGAVVGLDGETPCSYADDACVAAFESGAVVKLEARPAAGHSFVGWLGGGCEGADLICFVTMDGAQTVTATFHTESADTTTVLTSSANPAELGQAVTLTATVGPVGSASDVPAGSVQFLNLSAGNSLGFRSLDPTGSATLALSVPAGSHSIKAIYLGDGTFMPSSSDVLEQVITAVNHAPVNTVPGPQSVNEDMGHVFNADNATRISVSDVDDAHDAVGDQVAQVTLAVTTGTLTLSGDEGLTFSVGADGTGAMTVTGTIASLNAALNGLVFTPALHFSGAATLTITTNDLGNLGSGGPLSDADTVAITVTAVNDAPINSVPGPQSVNEDTAHVFNAHNATRISVSDVDDADDGAVGDEVVQVTLAAPTGALTLNATTGLTFTAGANSTAAMTVTGTISDINNALNGLVFVPALDFSGPATLTITTNDLGNFGVGGMLSDTDTIAITVTGVNDAPVNSVPGPQSLNEDTTLVFSAHHATRISIADADDADQPNPAIGDLPVQVTLNVGHGALTLSATAGLTFSAGANHTAAMTVTGAISNINNALNGLIYLPALDFSGPATLTITTNDLGNFGVGGARTDIDTIAIAVEAPVLYSLTTNIVGSGAVSKTPGTCAPYNPSCADVYLAGTVVTLTATPAAGYRFTVWTGCDSIAALQCTVTMASARSVIARFEPILFSLTTSVIGAGFVTPDIQPNCRFADPACSDLYTSGTIVTLTATPLNSSYRFSHWGSGCATMPAPNKCMVALSQSYAITAHFEPVLYALTTNVVGSGAVLKTPSPCAPYNPSCTDAYLAGTTVTLTATPAPGFRLPNWSGCDSQTATTCTIVMASARTVTITFVSAATTTTLRSSVNPSIVGEAVTLTAQVAPTSGDAGSPSGSVTFSDGTTVLGTSALDATGKAVFTTSGLTPGTHIVTAAYGGDSVFVGSSTVTSHVVRTATEFVGVIGAAVHTSGLNATSTNALLTKLTAASQAISRGQQKAAANQLNAFVNNVQALVNSGRLSTSRGLELIVLANKLAQTLD